MPFFDSAIYYDFRDISIFHPLFKLKSPIMTLSEKFEKSDFLGYCSFTQLFHDVEKLRRKHKIFLKVIQRFWCVQHVGLIFKKKPTRSNQSCNFGKILQFWKNLGMLPSSRFWDTIFSTLFNTYVYRRVSFSAVDIIISKKEEILGPQFLMMVTTISFFYLKVWLFGGWAETSLNQFEQKLLKIALHRN